MKRRTFQASSRGSAPPPAEPARGSQHIVLRIVLIAFVAAFLAEFVPAPWAFHIGSRFTPLGQWDGYGPVQASDGGRYLLFTHLQGGVFAWAYPRLMKDPGSVTTGLAFAAGAALLSWTFTTLAVAAKHPMTSIGGFMAIETAFTIVQFALVGPLCALAARTRVAEPRTANA